MKNGMEQLVLMEKRAGGKLNGFQTELSEETKALCRVLDRKLAALEERLRPKFGGIHEPERPGSDCA